MCLSHCWGKTQPIKTTKAAFSSMTNQIPWSQIPKTFREAMEFTIRMGYRYLWIDSLCIIQDDMDDWNLEAMKMASVYQSCDLCLAATASPDSTGGLAFKNPDLMDPVKIGRLENDGRRYDVFFRNIPDHATIRGSDTPGFPLLERGWVVQERLLSPCILHFCPSELLWECSEITNCECGYASEGTNFKGQFEPSRTAGSKDNKLLYAHWRELVGFYSRQKLTVRDDILPALAGIAKYWMSYRSDAYIAGCWGYTILLDIIWHHPPTLAQHPVMLDADSYTAPSWSWASTNLPVEFPRILDFKAASKVLDVLVANVNDDATGRVITGSLTLCGPWFETELGSGVSEYTLKIGEGSNNEEWGDTSYWLVLKQVRVEPPLYQRCGLGIDVDTDNKNVQANGVFSVI